MEVRTAYIIKHAVGWTVGQVDGTMDGRLVVGLCEGPVGRNEGIREGPLGAMDGPVGRADGP